MQSFLDTNYNYDIVTYLTLISDPGNVSVPGLEPLYVPTFPIMTLSQHCSVLNFDQPILMPGPLITLILGMAVGCVRNIVE